MVLPISYVSLSGWLLVVIAALVFRNRAFAAFAGVFTGIYTLSALGLAPLFAWNAITENTFVVFHALVYVSFIALSRPSMHGLPFRLLVSWPAAFFAAWTLLGIPWAIASAIGFHPWGAWLPYALAAVGLYQSLAAHREEVDLVVYERDEVDGVVPHPRGKHREERPLSVVQITDPHLGPFMSVERLRSIAQRAVDAKPDLIFLTGDFLTMESQRDPTLLKRALEPLRAYEGKVFACNGNHDHEAPRTVADALAANGIRQLVDEATTVCTDAGPVQIVGMDFAWRDRAERLAAVCAENPRISGHLRIVLLHDPGAFRHLPVGEGDLVLSGHTHGGQVGPPQLGLLVDVSSSLRQAHPRPRLLGARSRSDVRASRNGSLRVSASSRGAVGGERHPRSSMGASGVMVVPSWDYGFSNFTFVAGATLKWSTTSVESQSFAGQ
ncbi:hypothetical protein BH09MYX1_BH09MYX1_02490 [soil metagenome]